VATKVCDDPTSRASGCEDNANWLLEAGKNELAFKYATKACDSSTVYCEPLVRMYQSGKGTKRDPAAAQSLIKKMCVEELDILLDSLRTAPFCKENIPAAKPTAKSKPRPKTKK
jgi:hypothetical protein